MSYPLSALGGSAAGPLGAASPPGRSGHGLALPARPQAAPATSSSVMRTRLGSTFTPGPIVDDSVTERM